MPPREALHISIASATHPGMSGKQNEDCLEISGFSKQTLNGEVPVSIAVIADGIGGHLAGEVASDMAIKIFSEEISRSNGTCPRKIMRTAIEKASAEILDQALTYEEKRGMGTTIVAAWIESRSLFISYVGNSRIYLLRKNTLYQLNIDHSWVQEAVDAGALTPGQARNHPNSNVIRRYVGSRIPVEVDCRLFFPDRTQFLENPPGSGFPLKGGDRLLLCSDGLNDMVEDPVIRQLIQKTPIETAVNTLIEEANKNGGRDNISVILLEISKENDNKSSEYHQKSLMGIPSGLVIVLLIILGAVILFGFLTILLIVFNIDLFHLFS
ncbi:MAG: serine/threonine-protein phosphatase [Anaerolineales bacterium]|nr:serine/threonine-protein phosphatase [Anaerolineales bacterium]